MNNFNLKKRRNALVDLWPKLKTDKERLDTIFSFFPIFKIDVSVKPHRIYLNGKILEPGFDKQFGEGLEELILEKCKLLKTKNT